MDRPTEIINEIKDNALNATGDLALGEVFPLVEYIEYLEGLINNYNRDLDDAQLQASNNFLLGLIL